MSNKNRFRSKFEAIDILLHVGCEHINKTIILPKNLGGLKKCAALDYLINHHGFKAI